MRIFEKEIDEWIQIVSSLIAGNLIRLKQSVREHLEDVSLICRRLAEKIGVPDAGELLGLLHDLWQI